MTHAATIMNKLVVIGIGLIGGSLATGLKQRGACREVIGIARREQPCADAVAHGVVDRAYTKLDERAKEVGAGGDMFISAHTLAVSEVLRESLSTAAPGGSITVCADES